MDKNQTNLLAHQATEQKSVADRCTAAGRLVPLPKAPPSLGWHVTPGDLPSPACRTSHTFAYSSLTPARITLACGVPGARVSKEV